MFDFLEGFENRMEFVAIVDSVVNRKNTNNEIEGWFEKEEMDNLFFSLLVYIMEQTLSENDECTMDNIAGFLDSIIHAYGKHFSFDKVTYLAEYMVKDILQNKGLSKTYGTMNYFKTWNETRVRLISDKISADNKITYQLTDQGYNFLFRTKEVDKALDFKLEQLKLKELLKRKNYKHALNQSKNLINMLRQKKRDLDEFINKIKRNIHDVDREEYENLIKETYDLIDEEYEGMLELKEGVNQDRLRIKSEMEESGYYDQTVDNALNSLDEINRNLQVVIGEQRNLIGKRFNMNDVYEETIKNSFFTSIVKRYDFEKEIILPLENIDENEIYDLWKLMTPLYKPNLNKLLNLSLIYQRQGKLREIDEDEGTILDDVFEEDMSFHKRKEKNEINYRIIESLFMMSGKLNKSFLYSDFYNHLIHSGVKTSLLTDEKRIFLIILKLYEVGLIDINEWKNRDKEDNISEANGEFDLSWCLYKLENRHPGFFNVSKLIIEKSENKFHAAIEEKLGGESIKSYIEMDDFTIIPVLERVESDD